MTTTDLSVIDMTCDGERFILAYPPGEYARAMAAAIRWTNDTELPMFGHAALHAMTGLILEGAAAEGRLAQAERQLDAADPQPSGFLAWLWRKWFGKSPELAKWEERHG